MFRDSPVDMGYTNKSQTVRNSLCNIIIEILKLYVVLEDLTTNLMFNVSECQSQGLNTPDPPCFIKRKDMLGFHFDYDSQTPGVKLLVTGSRKVRVGFHLSGQQRELVPEGDPRLR